MPEHDDLPQAAGGKLTGRTILIAGAGSDLGAAFCMSAAKAGANVLLVDRKRRLLEEICQRVETFLGDPAMIEFDVRKAGEGDYESFAEGVSSLTQTLHGAVHCGLSAWPLAPVVNSKFENWHRIHGCEVVQPVALMRSLFPVLKNAESASVLFCTMSAGRRGRAYWGAVGSAFAALENISETLAAEWEKYNIRVNTVDISCLPSDLRTRYYPGEVKQKSGHDYGLDQVLTDLLRADSATSGKRVTLQQHSLS